MLKRFLPALHSFSIVLLCVTFAMFIPLSVSIYLKEQHTAIYLRSMLICLLFSFVLYLVTKKHSKQFNIYQAIIFVCCVWVLVPLFATIPFIGVLDSLDIKLSFFQAYFEMVSCITTTGATVFLTLDNIPVSINFWRAFLQWLGGMGIVLLALAILPFIGVSGKQLYRLETAGPIIESSSTPKFSQTAKYLWSIYLFVSVLCFLLYRLTGVEWLDSFMLTFTTVSLGGASIRVDNISFYDSGYTELVTMLFMVLGSLNYALYFNVLRHGKFAQFKDNIEVKATLCTVILTALFVSAFLYYKGTYTNLLEALRYGSFNSISIVTTTGFTISDFSVWPTFVPILLVLLSSIASSAGSTGGGIKMMRIILLIKQAQSEFTKLLHPASVNPVVVGGKVVESKVIFSVSVFIFFYVATVVVLGLVLMATDLDALTAFSAIFGTINCMGNGLGLASPEYNFSMLSDFQLSVCTFAMLLGRLEIISLLVIFAPVFWRE